MESAWATKRPRTPAEQLRDAMESHHGRSRRLRRAT